MKRRIINTIVALMAMATASNAQQLSVGTIEAVAGKQTEMTVSLTGATGKTALQYNLSLPAGLTLAETTGDYGIKVGNATKGHTLSVSPLASGDLLIVLYSMYQDTFADGTLMTIPVVTTGENGTTSGTLNTIRTATADAVSSECADVSFNAVVTPLTLADGETYTNASSSSVASLAYTRTFNNTNWQALYVPFAMSYEDWSADFDVAKINDIHQFDEDGDDILETTKLEIVKVKSGSLKANHPYMIRAKSTGAKTITLDNVTLEAAVSNSIDCSSVERKYIFTGTYEKIAGTTMVENNYFAMSGGSMIPTTNSNASLKPYRWYMQIQDRDGQIIQDVSEVKVIVKGEEDWDTTGISENSADVKRNDDGVVYDLNGRKVTNPAKGLYIKNGKKFIVK